MINRRMALKTLGAGLAVGRTVAAPALAPSALDHLECWVTSAPGAAAFYARVFGNQVLKNQRTERRYVRLGSAYLAMDQGQAVHVDHVCAGIPNFQIADVHQYLTERSVAFRDYPSGRDTAVTEPGGQRLQLAADHGWELLMTGTAAAETLAIPAAPIFTPLGLESVLLRVPDLEASARFFTQLLGDPSIQGAERWFSVGSSRLGIRAAEASGVEYIRVTARPFSAQAAVSALEKVGAREAKAIGNSEVEFGDSDGYRWRVVPG